MTTFASLYDVTCIWRHDNIYYTISRHLQMKTWRHLLHYLTSLAYEDMTTFTSLYDVTCIWTHDDIYYTISRHLYMKTWRHLLHYMTSLAYEGMTTFTSLYDVICIWRHDIYYTISRHLHTDLMLSMTYTYITILLISSGSEQTDTYGKTYTMLRLRRLSAASYHKVSSSVPGQNIRHFRHINWYWDKFFSQ